MRKWLPLAFFVLRFILQLITELTFVFCLKSTLEHHKINKNAIFIPLKGKKKLKNIFIVAVVQEKKKTPLLMLKKNTLVIFNENNLWHVLHITYSESHQMLGKGFQ